MKRVARKKRKRGGFTRVNACHLADAQSDLLLFLRNPTRFPIWDENSFLLRPSMTRQDSPFNPLYRGENRIPNSLFLSLFFRPFPPFLLPLQFLFVFGFSPPHPRSCFESATSLVPYLEKIISLPLDQFEIERYSFQIFYDEMKISRIGSWNKLFSRLKIFYTWKLVLPYYILLLLYSCYFDW